MSTGSSFKNVAKSSLFNFFYMTYASTDTPQEVEDKINNLLGGDVRNTIVLLVRVVAPGIPTVTDYAINATLLLPQRDLEGDDIWSCYENRQYTRFYGLYVNNTYANATGSSVYFTIKEIPDFIFGGIHLNNNPYFVQSLSDLEVNSAANKSYFPSANWNLHNLLFHSTLYISSNVAPQQESSSGITSFKISEQ